MNNHTDNTNGNVPLTVENVWYFQFLWDQGLHMFFCKEKQSQLINHFLYKKVFILWQQNRDHM